MTDIIKDLLGKKPFRLLNEDDKLAIVKSERPQPPLHDLKCEHKEKKRAYTRYFNVSAYKKFAWLAGSTMFNKLYCWPCLLFSNDVGPWNSGGFGSLNYLNTACFKHEKSIGHIKAFTALQTFGSQKIDHSINMRRKLADSEHNERVRENRNVLKRLIDVTVFLGKQGGSFGEPYGPRNSNGKSSYVKLLEFLASYDLSLANHLKTATVFNAASPLIQNDLVDAVASTVSAKIKSEVFRASFVSISLGESSNVVSKSRLSTVVRYVDHEGNCQERFLRFSDVSSNQTAQALFEHITKVIDDLACSDKLVAQAFDGASVKEEHVTALQVLLKNKYPTAPFIQCCSDTLTSAFCKSVTYIKECQVFFTSLSAISSFFGNSQGRTNAFQAFMETKHPVTALAAWKCSSKLVGAVKDYRMDLKEFFLSVEDEASNWTPEEVTAASGFVRFLSKFDTKFLLLTFHKLFVLFDELFDDLETKNMDVPYCIGKINEFYDVLRTIRDIDFEQLWVEATNPDEEDDEDNDEPTHKRLKLNDHRYKLIFDKILDTALAQTKFKVESLTHLKFLCLLDCNNFHSFSAIFPENLLCELKEPYAKYFDTNGLKNELKVLYALDEYRSKSVREIASFMKLNRLDIVFSEVYKLAELVLTFPSTTDALPEGSLSSLDRIESYVRASRGQVRLSNLDILCVEKEMLVAFKKYSAEAFYENVTLKFTQKEKERSMEFMYK